MLLYHHSLPTSLQTLSIPSLKLLQRNMQLLTTDPDCSPHDELFHILSNICLFQLKHTHPYYPPSSQITPNTFNFKQPVQLTLQINLPYRPDEEQV